MDNYKPSLSKEVQIAEKELQADITELKNALFEQKVFTYAFSDKDKRSTKITHLSGASFVPLVPEYFTKERNLAIKNQLNVYDAFTVKNQGQIMTDEMDSAMQSDVTLQSLPLLLHQFYLDQMKRYVQCYHAQMLRWKRYSEHVETLAWMYAKYKLRLVLIKKRYDDSKQRSQRLATSQLSYLIKDSSVDNCLEPEDISIFLRWLVFHLRCTKKVFSYLKLLQWLPVSHRHSIHIEPPSSLQQRFTTGITITPSPKNDARLAWKDMTDGMDFSYLSPTPSSYKAPVSNSVSTALICDQSFTGFLSNEATLSIPSHVTDLSSFRAHLDALVVEYGIVLRSELATSSDEMELFGTVNRHFKNLFNRQTECNKFYQYDNVPEGYNHWGIHSATYCLKKLSNWQNHIRIKPRFKSCQLQQITNLKEDGNMDELLTAHNRFLEVSEFSQVTESLKEHALAVCEPPVVQTLLVTSNPKGKLRTCKVWNSIYKVSDNSDQHESSFGDHTAELAKGDRRARRHSKKESYSYLNTLQMLGLDEGDGQSNQDTTVKGAYLSYIYLRHLKIRDLRRQCLAVLNYFRSIERTITIYDGGLSHKDESAKLHFKIEKVITDDIKRKEIRQLSLGLSEPDFATGADVQSRGLNSHIYMQDKPDYFKIDEDEFMQFHDIENHDDFYSFDKSHDDVNSTIWKCAVTSAKAYSPHSTNVTPHVQDYRGFYIVYDAALQDLENLTDELLMLASHYIEKDEINRSVRRSPAEKEILQKVQKEDLDLAEYAHREVDRFAVLLDLWTCEQNFLFNKRKLLDCFVEAYHHTFDPEQRNNLTQIITDIIYQRPRYDLTDDYFVRSYRAECTCLGLKTTLISQILSNHMEDSKNYVRRTARSADVMGMPMYCESKQEMTVNLPKPALKHVNMFEFHPNAGIIASRLYEGIEIVFHKMEMIYRPTHMNEFITLEKQVLEHSMNEWDSMSAAGSSYNEQVQKDIFSDDFVEDIRLVDAAVHNLIAGDQAHVAIDPSVEKKKNLQILSKALDAVLLRHRLHEAAWETEIVSKLYKKVTLQLGFDETHLHSRPLCFENETTRKNVDPSPTKMTNFAVHDCMAEKYYPIQLCLAVQELDAKHLAQFSFQNANEFVRIVTDSEKLQNVRVALACQIIHKNLLIVAVTQAENCALWNDAKPISHNDSDNLIPRESTDTPSRLSEEPSQMTQRSLQFVTAQSSKRLSVFRSSSAKYTSERHRRMTFRGSLHAMRAQIIACYSGILSSLASYPSMRERFFMVGLPHEEKRQVDDVEGMVPDPKIFQRRPRRVLSSDGTAFLNLWFIPHYTEILASYRNFDWEMQEHILITWLSIASSLHDIVLHLCARARLERVSNQKNRLVCESTAAIHFEEAEVIGIQLNEIQVQINNLQTEPYPYAKVPGKVAELLTMKKQILFHHFDVAIQYTLRESLLALNNNEAYQCVTDNMSLGLFRLSDATQPSLTAIQVNLPKALVVDMKDAFTFMPWLRFQRFNGSHCTAYCEYWEDSYSSMLLCIAGLKKKDRILAIQALQHVDTILKRVLHDGAATRAALDEIPEELPKGFIISIAIGKLNNFFPPVSQPPSHDRLRKLSSTLKISDVNVPNAARNELRKKRTPKYDPQLPLNKLLFPMDACRLMKAYLRLWKQLECFKLDWAKAKFKMETIDTPAKHRQMNQAFRTNILLPVYIDMACRMGAPDMYHDTEASDTNLQPPPGFSILATKAKLLTKLLESYELRAIADARQVMRREYRSLLLSDKHSKHSSNSKFDSKRRLSTDYYLEEERPLIVDDFITELLSQSMSNSDQITFDLNHFNRCLSRFDTNVLRREKDDYSSFSSRFDRLLRHYTHLLDAKNLQTRSSEASWLDFDETPGQFSQYQLADRSPELIMEVTALRAKVTEMEDMILKTKVESRQLARIDCELTDIIQDLMQYLFDACFEMKSRLASQYVAILDDIFNQIAKTRAEALKRIGRVKHMDLASTADERLKIINVKVRRAAKLENRTTRLDEYACKVQKFRCWQHFTQERRFISKAGELEQKYSRLRRVALFKNLQLKEESDYYYQELVKVRKLLQKNNKQLTWNFSEQKRRKHLNRAREYKEIMAISSRRTFSQARDYYKNCVEEEIREKDERLKSAQSEFSKLVSINNKKKEKMKSMLKRMNMRYSVDHSLRLEASEFAEQLESIKSSSFDRSTIPGLSITRPTTATLSVDQSSLCIRDRSRSLGSTPLPKPKLRERPYSCMPNILLREPVAPWPKRRPFTSTEDLKERLSTAIRNGYYPVKEREKK